MHPGPPCIYKCLVSATFFHSLKETHPVCCVISTFISCLQLPCWKGQWVVHPNPVSLAWHDFAGLSYLLSDVAFATEEPSFALILPARRLLHTSEPLPILKHFDQTGHPNHTKQQSRGGQQVYTVAQKHSCFSSVPFLQILKLHQLFLTAAMSPAQCSAGTDCDDSSSSWKLMASSETIF